MLGFNKKLILSSTLTPARCIFDPTYSKLVFKNNDHRDTPKISYTLNGRIYETPVDKKVSYDLPEIDTYYTLEFTGIPKKTNYRGFSGTTQIYKNHEECKDFIYKEKNSNTVYGYKGTNNKITIPDKYNMINTITASIDGFPNVSGLVDITTNQYMKQFLIRGNNVNSITIKNLEFTPSVGQFENMTNLTQINYDGVLESCPEKLFYNCSKLTLPANMFKDLTEFGADAFYNTNNIKSIRFAGDTLVPGVFDYSGTGSQKAIFTSASSINGLTNADIPYGKFTDGMLYNGDKKHQIYCGVTDSVWRDGPAKSNKVNNLGYNQSTVNAPDDVFLFKPADSNVFGLDIVVKNEEGTELNHTQNILEPNTTYSLSEKHVYGKNMPATDPFDIKYGVDTDVSFYDKLYLTTIDSTGLMNTSIQSPYGEIGDKPRYRLRYLFKCDAGNLGPTRFQLTYQNYTFTVTVPRGKIYDYILCDNNNTNICMARYVMRNVQNGIDLGLNGKGVQHPELKLIKSFGDYGIYQIIATDYYDYDVYTSGSQYNFPAMLFFYRSYRYGYINEKPVGTPYNSDLQYPAGSTSRLPELLSTNQKNDFEKWYDVWYENGDPSWPPLPDLHMLMFWTTQDNSTLYLNGEVWATNVPKYRMYFRYDPVAPRLRFKLFLVNGPNEVINTTDKKYYYDEIIFDKNMGYSGVGYIDLLDYATEEQLTNWVHNSYHSYSPHIRYGYADVGNDDFKYVNGRTYGSLYFLNAGMFGDGSFVDPILTYEYDVTENPNLPDISKGGN